MHILIDTPGNWSGGFLAHLKGILSESALSGNINVTVICSPKFADALDPVSKNVTIVIDRKIKSSIISQYLWRKIYLPRILDRIKPDVHFNPLGIVNNSRGIKIPFVTMSRNLHPFSPKYVHQYGFSKVRLILFLRKFVLLRSFKKANGVIFLSSHAQELITNIIKINDWTIIPHGVGSTFSGERNKVFPQGRKSIELLYVSSIWLYKNHSNVIDAVDILIDQYKLNVRLSIVGSGEPIASRQLKNKIQSISNSNSIRHIEYVEYSKIKRNYNEADIFVFASSCENYPNILVEAMMSGLPIACSNLRPMIDILGDGGVYFNPESSSSIADSIRLLIENPEIRQNSVEIALKNIADNTWERCAKDTFDYLRYIYSEYN